MANCVLCRRDFTSKEALNQHERDSPVHRRKFRCDICDSFFASNNALEQHQRDSPVHNKTFHCMACDQSLKSAKALKNHRQSCVTVSDRLLDAVDPSLYQARSDSVLSDAWSKCPTTSQQSLLFGHSAQTLASAVPIRSRDQKEGVPKSTAETREFFRFPELHQLIEEAVSPYLSQIWFNTDQSITKRNHEWYSHVVGRFTCNNSSCRKQFWDSGKVPIEINGYKNNGYNAIVYNQRCKVCSTLGALDMDQQSYVDRVSYRLQKWAGLTVQAPPFNMVVKRMPHESIYCEGCKRGKCKEGDGSRLI